MKSKGIPVTALVLCVAILFVGCHNPKSTVAKTQTAVVERMVLDKPLYFSGTLQPLKVVNIPSPADGFVVAKQFEYGQRVEKGAVILTLNSDQLQKDYNNALTGYLKSKQELASSSSKLKNDQELLKLGIIAKEAYEQTKNTYDNDRILFLQAVNSVKESLKNAGGDFSAIEKLDITDVSAVDTALKKSYQKLQVKSNNSGVVLMPIIEEQANQNDKKIMIGSKVETGQVLVSIGDLSGLSVDIKVSENDVERIHAGTKVEITGNAFPNRTLTGVVQSVDSEAKQEQAGAAALPQFSARVIVPHLTPEELQHVRVGMSAKIRVQLNDKPQLVVPIAALHETGRRDWVKLLKNGAVVEKTVTTGQASEECVEILAGLQQGDRVLIDEKTA